MKNSFFEKSETEQVTEIMVEEVQQGNRPLEHLVQMKENHEFLVENGCLHAGNDHYQGVCNALTILQQQSTQS